MAYKSPELADDDYPIYPCIILCRFYEQGGTRKKVPGGELYRLKGGCKRRVGKRAAYGAAAKMSMMTEEESCLHFERNSKMIRGSADVGAKKRKDRV